MGRDRAVGSGQEVVEGRRAGEIFEKTSEESPSRSLETAHFTATLARIPFTGPLPPMKVDGESGVHGSLCAPFYRPQFSTLRPGTRLNSRVLLVLPDEEHADIGVEEAGHGKGRRRWTGG